MLFFQMIFPLKFTGSENPATPLMLARDTIPAGWVDGGQGSTVFKGQTGRGRAVVVGNGIVVEGHVGGILKGEAAAGQTGDIVDDQVVAR